MYMFPPVLLLIPLFIVLKTVGLINSPFGLILAYTTFSLPFCIWMLKGFFDSIPMDLEEQAMVDGCTQLSSMVRVLLPLSGPAYDRYRYYICSININSYTGYNFFLLNYMSL